MYISVKKTTTMQTPPPPQKIKYPEFPTNLAYLAGLFDAVYTTWRSRGHLRLTSKHAAPLEVIMNWFPGKYDKISDIHHELNMSGAPAQVLLGCVKQYVRTIPDKTRDLFPDIHPDVALFRSKGYTTCPDDDVAWLLGYYYACVGEIVTEEVSIQPFNAKKNRKVGVLPTFKNMNVTQEANNGTIKVLLKSNAPLLHRIVSMTHPSLPETIDKECQVCLRQRLVNKAIQDYSTHVLKQRPRHASMTPEQLQMIQQHVQKLGVIPLSRLMGLSVKQVKAYMGDRQIPVNTINSFIHERHQEGMDRYAIKGHVRNKFGVNLSIGAISSRLYRLQQKEPVEGYVQ